MKFLFSLFFTLVFVFCSAQGQSGLTFGGPQYEYGKSLAINDEGDLFLVGSTKSFGTDGSVDVYVVKTDGEGNELWSVNIGGSKNDFGEGVIALSDGGCAIAGSTESFGHGASDMYFLRLSSDGEVNIFNSITPPNKEAFVFYPNPMLHVGNFELPDTGTANRFTVQLFDSYGHLVRQRTMNGTKYTLNRENLSSGTYFYSIVSEDVPGIRYKGKLIA